MTRSNFTRTTMLAAWERSGGYCERKINGKRADGCGRKIFPSDGPEYDHIIADEHGGDNSLDNCQVLCVWCHKPKTRADMKVTVHGRKVRAAHARADKPKRVMPGSRGHWQKKPLHGNAVRREDG